MGVFLILFLFICTMISDSVDAIIFDLGGVIIDIDYEKTIHAFEKLGMKDFHSVYSQAAQSNLFDDFETGQISTQRFINSLLPYLKLGTSPNKAVHAWNEMILSIPKEKIVLLNRLKEKYPLYLLSNTNEIHVPIVKREWAKVSDEPMESIFKKVYFSNEIELRKPNLEIFKHVCAEQNLKPERTLFIDDSIQHIEGAKEFGLQTFFAQNSDSLYNFFS